MQITKQMFTMSNTQIYLLSHCLSWHQGKCSQLIKDGQKIYIRNINVYNKTNITEERQKTPKGPQLGITHGEECYTKCLLEDFVNKKFNNIKKKIERDREIEREREMKSTITCAVPKENIFWNIPGID